MPPAPLPVQCDMSRAKRTIVQAEQDVAITTLTADPRRLAMIGSFKQTKKDEEDGGRNPYHCTDKTSVLQEARVFNETPVNVKRSTHVLTKILYLLNQGESLATKEATDAFFAMTKLFQSNDLVLRRLVYLGIKVRASYATSPRTPSSSPPPSPRT
ncbi:Coatomer subunit gamma [Chionoecetes opilio]|uniref:Coatomer subunit gamma n=1 Tax=Chionoecetes opilio TaxID=41210 RepID=A0A8J5BTP7_CHIOP|nr:Coatomer subunit gamma [Chionoecetes opilio]